MKMIFSQTFRCSIALIITLGFTPVQPAAADESGNFAVFGTYGDTGGGYAVGLVRDLHRCGIYADVTVTNRLRNASGRTVFRNSIIVYFGPTDREDANAALEKAEGCGATSTSATVGYFTLKTGRWSP